MATRFGKCGHRLRRLIRFLGSRFTENSAVLLYHRVAEDEWDPFKLCVSPRRFGAQLDALPQLGKIIEVGEFVRRQREGRLEKGSLCLTFDDGYVDFLDNALPLLEARELPATIFCVAEELGQPLWWDRLHDLLAAAPGSPAISLESAIGRVSLSAGWSLPAAFRQIYPFCKSLPPEARLRQIEVLESQLFPGGEGGLEPNEPDRRGERSRRLMSAEEIAALASHPLVTIGAHTLSHPSLAFLTPEEQFAEIAGSVRKLSEIAGHPVTTFSYPYGLSGRDFDAATLESVRRAGLDHAFAADPWSVAPNSDPMALPRLWVHDIDGSAFVRQIGRWL